MVNLHLEVRVCSRSQGENLSTKDIVNLVVTWGGGGDVAVDLDDLLVRRQGCVVASRAAGGLLAAWGCCSMRRPRYIFEDRYQAFGVELVS